MHAYLKSVSAGTLALLTASVVSLAMTGAGTDGPHGLLDVQARDSAGATAITEMVKALSGEGEAGGWDVQRDGDDVRVSVGDPGGGALVDSARFRSAIPALSTTTTLAAYVDVQGLLKATKVVNAGVMRRWAPVQAVGLAVGQSGGDLTATLRIIVA